VDLNNIKTEMQCIFDVSLFRFLCCVSDIITALMDGALMKVEK
jgi:hypothetical protein